MKIAQQIAQESLTVAEAEERAIGQALSWHMTAYVTRSKFSDGSVLAIHDNEMFALDPSNWCSVRSYILWLGTACRQGALAESNSPLEALRRSSPCIEHDEFELLETVHLNTPELISSSYVEA